MPEATSQQEEKTTGRRDKAPTSEMTVKDCIVWDRPGDKKEETPREYQHKFLIKKGEVGKSQDRGYTVPSPPPPKLRDATETAGQALRGWPELSCHKSHEAQQTVRIPEATETVGQEEKRDNKMKDIMEQKFANESEDGKQSEKDKNSETIKRKEKNPEADLTPRKGKEFDNTLEGRRPWRM